MTIYATCPYCGHRNKTGDNCVHFRGTEAGGYSFSLENSPLVQNIKCAEEVISNVRNN